MSAQERLKASQPEDCGCCGCTINRSDYIPQQMVRNDPHLAEDIETGAAVRRLVEARGGQAVAFLLHDGEWTAHGSGFLPTPRGATLAEAADKCREALEAGS